MSIHYLQGRENPRNGGDGVAGGGNPPYDVDMEARLTKLEEFASDARERLTKIEVRLEQTATRGDLHEQTSTMVKWIVGTVSGLGLAGITIMTFVLNNAVPKSAPAPAAPAAPPAPIIIYAQPAPVAAPPAAPPVKP
jgi:hypothetical protein